MSTKTIYSILRFSGTLIMLLAFLIIPDSKPWYYGVILFDVGLLLFLIPKFSIMKRKVLKLKAKL